jgi:DNA-binding beta-propeller fold protein YncE
MQVAPPELRPGPDVLIPEARQRQRRRRWTVALLLVSIGVSATIGYTAIHGTSGSPPPTTRAVPAPRPVTPTHAGRGVDRPATLAAGPHGLLYIADDTRNMIFARHLDGSFSVVAGTGRRGFSGDGHLATEAELNHPAGMTYDTATSTLYVADTGNNRVRAIDSRGVIHTIARLSHPAAVALSPTGALFVTNGAEVARVDQATGTLTHVAGRSSNGAGLRGIGGPAARASVDGADGLALGRDGYLYLTGSNTKALLAVSRDGRMRDICSYCLYPRGTAGIITAPDGSIIAMAPTAIYRYTSPRTRQTVVNFATAGPVDGVGHVSPAGIAIATDGTIYVDTDDRAGYSSKTAIIEIPSGSATGHVIWLRR